MPSPITPSTFKTLIPNGSGSFCDEFKKLIRFISVFYQWFKYAFDEDGNPSAAFKGDMSGVTTVTDNTVPSKPTGLVASTNLKGTISLTWNATSMATSYRIYRVATDAIAEPPIATGVTSTSYTDTVTAGNYYYWVKAVNSLGTSAASDSALGTSLAGVVETDFTPVADDKIGTEYEVTVPGGMTELTVYLWAGGGGGAWGNVPSAWSTNLVLPQDMKGGGGGGAGCYAIKENYTVVDGEKVKFYRGAGGAIGGKGGDSYVKNNGGTVIVRCIGGYPGTIPTGGAGGDAIGTDITKTPGGKGNDGTQSLGGAGGTVEQGTETNKSPYAGYGGSGSINTSAGSSGGVSAESGQPGAILYLFS